MPGDVTIRAARHDDLEPLLALYRHLHPDEAPPDAHQARAAWAALMASDLTTVFVAEAGGALVASCTLVVVPNLTRGARPYAVIENVVTDPAYRRRGVGRAVLAAAVDRAWQARCYKVMLATGSRREETLRFYESAGFTRGSKTCFEIRA